MKILKELVQGSEEWHEERKGVVTGSKLKGLYSKKGTRKIGFYELIAEKLGIFDGDDLSSSRSRGKELEAEALEMFVEKTGKQVETVGFLISDENPSIANSPDGIIPDKKNVYTESVEAKCLSAANHLKAYFEEKIPSDYEAQKVQYFIVNPDLQKLYFVFYDPRIAALPYFVIEVNREDIECKIEEYREFQETTIKEVEAMVEELTF